MGKLINIDGSKLKALLESATGKTLATLGVENGYSKSILTNAVRRNTASPAVVALVRLYGIEPSAYEVKKVTTLRAIEAEREKRQLTIDDLTREDVRAELKELFKQAIREEALKESKLKALIKEVIAEALSPCAIVTGIDYDPIYKRFKLFVNEEDLK